MNLPNQKNHFRNPKVYNLPFEQSKKRPTKIWKPILILILMGGIYYFIFQSPYFQIKNIIIDQALPPAVSEYMTRYKGENIFTLRSSKIHDDLLAKYPELTKINVIRGIPDSIKVTCDERNPRLVWTSGSKMYLVDENGLAYKEIQDRGGLIEVKDNNNLPVKQNQPVVSANFISFINSLQPKLQDSNFRISHFEVNETTFHIDAVTVDNLILKFDITRSADSQVSDLTKFLENHQGEAQSYIDLRVEGKAFYK